MSFQRDSTSETRRRGSGLGPAASLDDCIDTREAFDAEVKALAARALRCGGYLDLQPTPITTVEHITDELLDLVASGAPARVDGAPAFIIEAWVLRRSGRSRPNRRAAESELEERRQALKVTLTKLVRAGVDVTAVVNVLDAARWHYVELVVRRGQKRMAAKLKRLKAKADRALLDLIRYHWAADRMVRKLRAPGTLEEYVGGETEQLYTESEPALTYMAAQDMLSRDARLNPSFLMHDLVACEDGSVSLSTTIGQRVTLSSQHARDPRHVGVVFEIIRVDGMAGDDSSRVWLKNAISGEEIGWYPASELEPARAPNPDTSNPDKSEESQMNPEEKILARARELADERQIHLSVAVKLASAEDEASARAYLQHPSRRPNRRP